MHSEKKKNNWQMETAWNWDQDHTRTQALLEQEAEPGPVLELNQMNLKQSEH